jgi:Ca-activated chloride channel family protein
MKICSIPILMLIVLGLAVPASADGIIIINPPPDVNIKLGQALTIKYHHVNVTIKNQMATTRVDQAFLNENPWPAEGTYIFPLPKGAAVSNFVMWIDGKPVKGEILGAKEARAIYDDIVRRMRDPALLEYVGRGALKASVFPIPPGGERRIQLEYSQLLTAENGLIHYLYPLSTEKHSARPLKEMAISASVESPDPIKAVYSPSHDVFIEREDDRHALLGLEEFDVLPEKDFELYYTVSPEKVGLNLLSFKEKGEDGFLLLLAAPNVEVNKTKVVAKDVILVLDNSGSMKDDGKLDQAKKAALYVLENLNPKDRFDVLALSTGQSFQPELQPAYERDKGAEFVRRLEARGGTDINRALLEALKMADPERPTTLIFLTDGLATQGVTDSGTILGNVQNASKRNVRIFSFGVGDDVDTDLLDQLSGDQRGMSTYVRPGQRIDESVSSFYSRISNPVLSEISLDFGNASVDQLYPERLPDLFAGDQLVLVGRYRVGGPANITLSGTVDGENESFLYPDGYLRKEGGDEFIPRLWATRAIGYYLTQIRLHGEKKEWVDAVVDLSIRYGIITPYTSFLIQEKDIFTQTGRQEIARRTQADMATERAYEAPTGAKAVTKAAFQGAMSYAAAPPEAPAMMMVSNGTGGGQQVKVAEVVKQVGSKTFVLRENAWIDTAFDKEAMKTVKVTFLTQAYFDLISSVPDLATYFALGEHVIAVYKGTAYEVVSS